MNYVQLLATCESDLLTILKVIRTVIKVLQWVIPIILIILATLDFAKIVTSGNADEKVVKEAQKKVTTRVIYAVVIFLIPTLVSLIFRLIPVSGGTTQGGATWKECWDQSAKAEINLD